MNWLGAEMTEQFTRMDESTQEQWQHIILTTLEAQPRVADHILFMLGALEGITDGFAINQLQHGLQTAARAEAAGAEDQWVVASLCHDIGKLISVPNHPRIAAEILRPYVDTEVAEVIAAHQDFQGKHYFAHVGLDASYPLRTPTSGHPTISKLVASSRSENLFEARLGGTLTSDMATRSFRQQ